MRDADIVRKHKNLVYVQALKLLQTSGGRGRQTARDARQARPDADAGPGRRAVGAVKECIAAAREAGQEEDAVPTTDDEIQEKYLERAIRELNELTHRLQECSHCPRGNLMPVLGSGHPQADIMLLKYAPTAAEIEEGVAFYGRAGNALMKSFKRLGDRPARRLRDALRQVPGLRPGARRRASASSGSSRRSRSSSRACIVVMGERGARGAQRASSCRCRGTLEPTLGEVQRLTPTIDALYVPDIDDSLDSEESKREFWSAFRVLGDWYDAAAVLDRPLGRAPWSSRSARSSSCRIAARTAAPLTVPRSSGLTEGPRRPLHHLRLRGVAEDEEDLEVRARRLSDGRQLGRRSASAHLLEAGAGQALTTTRRARVARAPLGAPARGRDADRSLGLAEPVEVVAVAVVEVAVERLLLGEPLRGVGADRGAHVAEAPAAAPGQPRARRPRRCSPRRGGELGGHPVEEGAVEAGAGRARTSSAPSPRARAARRGAPRAAPGAPRASWSAAARRSRRRRPSQRRSRSRPRRSISALISAGWWRSSAITATPSSSAGRRPRAKAASVSRPMAPGWSFDHIEE